MKTILLLSRFITGLVFIFSGFVKAIDPAGSAIKFQEYFQAFHLDFLVITALPLAILLSAAELMIGLNLVAGIRLKITAWLLLIFMSFFTVLTFILAVLNPVSDCGCFGDALKLTNWQTFWKNIILFVPALLIFLYRDTLKAYTGATFEWFLAAVNFLLAVFLSLYGIRHEPLMDFRPYKTGTFIPEKMTFPPGAPVDEFRTILVYEKGGIKQEFTESNFPWQDSSWKWVETRQKLIAKGYEPPIHDFSVTDESGVDITTQVLEDSGYTVLIISPFLHRAPVQAMEQMNDLALKARESGFQVHGLTSSTGSQILTFKKSLQPDFDLCTADETTLRTIIRSNPGVLLLKQGTILAKWNYRDAPRPDEISSNMLAVILSSYRSNHETHAVALLAVGVALFYAIALCLKTKFI